MLFGVFSRSRVFDGLPKLISSEAHLLRARYNPPLIYSSTGWFTLQAPNLFPSDYPRRFLDLDREILHVSMCPCEDLTQCFCFFLPDFRRVKIFRKMSTTLAQFFFGEKK